MFRRPPISTLTDTLFPYPTLFRSVGERDRTHRMVEAQTATRVDILHRCDALAEREDGFVDHRHQHAVDDEARRIIGVDDLLAEPAAKGFDLGERVVARAEERRVGKACVSTCRSRWSPYH